MCEKYIRVCTWEGGEWSEEGEVEETRVGQVGTPGVEWRGGDERVAQSEGWEDTMTPS